MEGQFRYNLRPSTLRRRRARQEEEARQAREHPDYIAHLLLDYTLPEQRIHDLLPETLPLLVNEDEELPHYWVDNFFIYDTHKVMCPLTTVTERLGQVFVCGNVYDFYNRENHIGYPINDLCVEAWGVFETHYGVARYGFKTDKAYYSLNHPHLCYEAVMQTFVQTLHQNYEILYLH